MDTSILTTRAAINSQTYVDKGGLSFWDHMPVVPTKIEEKFEDKVIVTLDAERYEILPFSSKRMKIIRHYEEVDEPDQARQAAISNTINAAVVDPRSVARQEGQPDRAAVAKSMQLITGDRVTHDAELWEILERLRAPQQQITITMPHGYTFKRNDERNITKLVQRLAEGDIKSVLSLIGHIQSDIDEDKIVDEHPGLIGRAYEKLFGRSHN